MAKNMPYDNLEVPFIQLENPLDLSADVFLQTETQIETDPMTDTMNTGSGSVLDIIRAQLEASTSVQSVNDLIEAIHAYYGEPEASGAIRSGFAAIKTIPQDTDLLWATSKNDIATLKKLLALELDVNVKGKYGETPLHIAACLGHHEAVTLLLENGADLSIKAYSSELNGFDTYGITAFELAIQENQKDIVDTMIKAGVLNQYTQQELVEITWYKAVSLLTIEEKFDPEHDTETVQNCLDIVLQLVPYTGTVYPNSPGVDFELPPLGALLCILASQTSHVAFHDEVLKAAAIINQMDCNTEHYILAKTASHILPIAGSYTIEYDGLDNKKTTAYFEAEGFYHIFSIPMIEETINAYLTYDHLSFKESNAFKTVAEQLSFTSDKLNALGLKATADALYEQYTKGETVLLPTGWEGHAVDVLMNKNLHMLIIANNGARSDDIDSGVNIFEMTNPDKVTPTLIHDILSNQEQMNLELKLGIKLGLKGLDSIDELDQITGNCAWQSQESAVEGMLFMHLLEEGHAFPEAMELAQRFYHHWDAFQTQFFITAYMEDPRVSADAVAEMIRTQAFFTQAKSLEELSSDPIGHALLDTYANFYHQNPATIKLDYDPYAFNVNDFFKFLDIESIDVPVIKNNVLQLDDVLNAPPPSVVHAMPDTFSAYFTAPEIPMEDHHQSLVI